MKVHKNVKLPRGAVVLPHEVKTANTLAYRGHSVEFIPAQHIYRRKSPDILLDGVIYEIKAPLSHKMATIERNLKKASKQARCIVFDSRRMKSVPDEAILAELAKQYRKSKIIKKIVFINRHGEVVDVTRNMMLK